MGKLFNSRKPHPSADEPKEESTDVDIDEIEDEVEIDEIDDDEALEDINKGKNKYDARSGEKESADEDEEEDEEDANEETDSEADARRVYRRNRRIRNQIIAYGTVVIFIVALIMSGVAVQRRISAFFKDKQEEQKLEAQLPEDEPEEPEQPPEDVVIEAPPVIEEEPENPLDEQLEEFITNCILEMPLEDKVAGLFVITPEALTGVRTVVRAGEGTQSALNQYAVGGLVYFSQNILNEEQLKEMLSNTVTMSKYPLFYAVDEEGGSVSRLADSGINVAHIDDMASIGAGGDAQQAYGAGATIGSYLNAMGFNLDFAPVADLADSGSEVLGSRSFGSDAEVTAEMVSNAVQGLEGSGVSACLKHFPGLGSTREDTHEGRVETTKSLEDMRNSDFIPFQAGIDAGANLVMVSHVTASGIDTEGIPSSLSRTVITDVLRGELGYDGIVITDALNMSAISEYYTSGEAAVRAINAGADMLLMPEDFEAAYKGLLTAVQDGTILEERIDESLRRIYRIKYADKLQ